MGRVKPPPAARPMPGGAICGFCDEFEVRADMAIGALRSIAKLPHSSACVFGQRTVPRACGACAAIEALMPLGIDVKKEDSMATQRWVELYRNKRNGEWRWRVRARNLKVLADSGEGYVSRGQARRMAESLFPTLDVREEPPDTAGQKRKPAPKTPAPAAAKRAAR